MKKDESTKTELTFKDISSEESRVYRFPDGSSITINEPIKINVSKSGGHRVLDKSGTSHYIPKGWNHLSWKAFEGQPNFVF